MNQFLKHLFTLLILVSSTFVYAQDLDFDLEKKKPFNPKFTLGTGFYTLTGDIDTDTTDNIIDFGAGANSNTLNFIIIRYNYSVERQKRDLI